MRLHLAAFAALSLGSSLLAAALLAEEKRPVAVVLPTADFEVTGDGASAAWQKAAWIDLRRRGDGGHDYTARVKLLHSPRGLYVLYEGSDAELTSKMKEDYADLWKEDVFEVFLWTDERHPIYFEYEISPLGYELPILVPNFSGQFLGWRPWHYDGDRRTRKATSAVEGTKESGARVKGWRAEVFIPYALLSPLQNVPPPAGARWRANFYRMDHDGGKSTGWDWSRVGPSFHEIEKFGVLEFQ